MWARGWLLHLGRERGMKVLDEYDDIIREATERYGVPAALIRAVIEVESAGNPHAVSKCGAIGFMQLMPATVSNLGRVYATALGKLAHRHAVFQMLPQDFDLLFCRVPISSGHDGLLRLRCNQLLKGSPLFVQFQLRQNNLSKLRAYASRLGVTGSSRHQLVDRLLALL